MHYAARKVFQSKTSAAENSRDNLKTNVLSCILRIFIFGCNQSEVAGAAHQPEVCDG
jgi:F0F1-type ATP synthase beta subunit